MVNINSNSSGLQGQLQAQLQASRDAARQNRVAPDNANQQKENKALDIQRQISPEQLAAAKRDASKQAGNSNKLSSSAEIEDAQERVSSSLSNQREAPIGRISSQQNDLRAQPLGQIVDIRV